MKKIFALVLALVLCFSVFSLSAFAADEIEEPEITETVENNPENEPKDKNANTETAPNSPTASINATQDDNAEWVDELTTELTSVATWGKIGVILSAVIALIVAISKIISPVIALVRAVKDNGATKSDVENGLEKIKSDFVAEFNKANAETAAKLEAAKDREDKLLIIVTILANSLKINPTAKAEIMNYLTGVTATASNAAETVKNITERIEEAIASEPVIETPALDAIAGVAEEKTEVARVALG